MAAATRVYCITNNATNVSRLVVAQNPAQAIRHVARDELACDIPTTEEALAMYGEGVKLERAKDEDDE
jgi:hypothetical protein